ncbi:MAG TPA: VOC family protein [Chitinophagaceae bacterium]|nr:VOC family protein [Chitinophagaceae bacterium]
MLTNPDGEDRPFITPSLMFTGDNTNHAEEAINLYLSIFKNSKKGNLAPYPKDTEPAKKGALMYGDLQIKNTWLAVMDSGVEQDFTFNEGISIIVPCEDQKEIDHYWEQLTADGGAESQCGGLKDKYGRECYLRNTTKIITICINGSKDNYNSKLPIYHRHL